MLLKQYYRRFFCSESCKMIGEMFKINLQWWKCLFSIQIFFPDYIKFRLAEGIYIKKFIYIFFKFINVATDVIHVYNKTRKHFSNILVTYDQYKFQTSLPLSDFVIFVIIVKYVFWCLRTWSFHILRYVILNAIFNCLT